MKAGEQESRGAGEQGSRGEFFDSRNLQPDGGVTSRRKIGWAIAVILLVTIPPSLYFSEHFAKQGTFYRYPFQRPDRGTIRPALEKEIAFYLERIRLDPDSGLNRAFLAKTYLKMARATGEESWYLLAEQTAQQSLSKLPFYNDGAILTLARIALARHEFTAAIRLVEQVGSEENSKFKIQNPKFKILHPSHQSEEALSILVTANLATGKVSEASRYVDALVNKTPDLNSLTLRALVQVALGKDEEAIGNFQQALAVEEPEQTGSSVWTRTLLGRLYFKRGQIKLARELYEESLRVLPQYAPATLNLAELEVRLGNYPAAERYYSQLLLTSKRAPTVYDHILLRGMARVKHLSGEREAAKEWLSKAEARLRQDVTGYGHRRELARLLLERGGKEAVGEALTLMQKEVLLRRDPETLDTLAEALSRNDRDREAASAMQEALRSGIRAPGLFYRAGKIEQALGNESGAAAYFRLVTETDPTFDEQAWRSLGLGVGLLGLN